MKNKCSLKKYFTPIFYYFSRSERRVTIKDDSTTAISQEISVEQSSSNKEQGIIHILRRHIFGLFGTPPSLNRNIFSKVPTKDVKSYTAFDPITFKENSN